MTILRPSLLVELNDGFIDVGVIWFAYLSRTDNGVPSLKCWVMSDPECAELTEEQDINAVMKALRRQCVATPLDDTSLLEGTN